MNDDEEAIFELTGRFFAFFDNRGGRMPQLPDFEALFIDGASIATHAQNGPVLCSAIDFVRPRVELLSSGALLNFHEWETEGTTEIRGTLGVRRSRYAKQGLLRGSTYDGQGTKYFQFAKLRGAWRISAVAWIDDEASDCNHD